MSAVEILPDVLEYKSPLTEQSTEYATISNNSAETIAFKVKTTAPKYYCVRPNAAVVAPGETVQIQVIFLGLPEEPSVDAKCRDKFLVITLPAPHDLGEKTVAEAWAELEAEFGSQAVSKKIKVKYVAREEPEVISNEEEQIPVETKREPVQEESENVEKEATSSVDVTPTSAISAGAEEDELKTEKKEVEESKADDTTDVKAANGQVVPQQVGIAIVVILIALIVRRFLL